MNSNGLVNILLASIAACGIVAAIAIAPAEGRPIGNRDQAKAVCVGEMGEAFSVGALRKIAAQIQKCDAGKWVLMRQMDHPTRLLRR